MPRLICEQTLLFFPSNWTGRYFAVPLFQLDAPWIVQNARLNFAPFVHGLVLGLKFAIAEI
ncbi:isopropylmalate isomerase small subunit [Roseobacter sp. MED193]|nr:isopropylmalate isomerase small subunit [Roseobacter sp. MED193]